MKTFYIGMKDRLLILKEENREYTANVKLEGYKINRIAFDPKNKDRIYVGTDKGLWRSEDCGEEWKRIGTSSAGEGVSIASDKVTSVAVHPVRRANGNSVVYAGTEPSRLYYSEDHGKTWYEFEDLQKLPSKKNWSFPPRPETHYVRWITPSYSNTEHIALSIEAGAILNTYDHGTTWVDRTEDSPIDAHTLLAHPKAPGRLYAANGDGTSDSRMAFTESEDEGKSWHYRSEGISEYSYLYNMAINFADPNDCLVSGSKNASGAHRSPLYSTIYRRRDQNSWEEEADGIPKEGAYTHHLAAEPKEAGAFYALNNFGLYYLAASKNTWERIEIAPFENYLDQRYYHFVVREE